MKKNTRRGNAKYPSLDPSLNLRSRWEEISDIDYLDKLNEEEKAWLNQFMGEYVNTEFKKKPKENLHRTKKARRECYARNNARNRDILTRAKASGNAVNIEDHHENDIFTLNNEQNIINKIDIENHLKQKKSRKKVPKGSSNGS